MFTLEKEQQDIVNDIAANFPYTIEEVARIYLDTGYSEEKTRDKLMQKLILVGEINAN